MNCKEKLNAAEGPKTLTSLLLPPVCTPSGHLLYLSRISRILLDDLIITDNAKGQKKQRKEKKKHHPRNELVKKTLSHPENFIIKLQIQKSQKIKSLGTFLNHFLNHFTNLLSASFSQSAAAAPDAD
jgi:hypothetical protein